MCMHGVSALGILAPTHFVNSVVDQLCCGWRTESLRQPSLTVHDYKMLGSAYVVVLKHQPNAVTRRYSKRLLHARTWLAE